MTELRLSLQMALTSGVDPKGVIYHTIVSYADWMSSSVANPTEMQDGAIAVACHLYAEVLFLSDARSIVHRSVQEGTQQLLSGNHWKASPLLFWADPTEQEGCVIYPSIWATPAQLLDPRTATAPPEIADLEIAPRQIDRPLEYLVTLRKARRGFNYHLRIARTRRQGWLLAASPLLVLSEVSSRLRAPEQRTRLGTALAAMGEHYDRSGKLNHRWHWKTAALGYGAVGIT